MTARATPNRFSRPCWAAFWLAALFLRAGGASAQEAQSADAGALSDQSVIELILDLDADEFGLRSLAQNRLASLASQSSQVSRLVRLFDGAALDQLPLESRLTLQSLRQGLSTAEVATVAAPCAPAEAERLAAELLSDRYAARLAARQRIIGLLALPANTLPLFSALRARVTGPALSPADAAELAPLWRLARSAWLAGDAQTRRLPAVSDAQVSTWIEQCCREQPAAAGDRRREIARLELELLLADDEQTPRVRKLLEQALAQRGDEASQGRLQDLIDLTEPAVAAEIWRQGAEMTNITIQYLVLGKPQWPDAPGAVTYTLFDRANEQTAHLANGNTLTPGDYPVDVIFPFQAKTAVVLFRIAYLPNPRARLLHEAQARRPDAVRWAEHCRRTLAGVLAEKRELSDLELSVLDQFDAVELSRFVGHYLANVPDRPLAADGGFPAPLVASRHGALCLLLIERGTPEATSGLVQAIDQGRIEKPNRQAPYALPWIAALAIAARSPEPSASDTLGGLIERDEPLEIENPRAADVGATAAAWLIARAGENPTSFHLERVEDPQLSGLGCPPGYRFAEERGRQAVVRWWQARRPPAADAP